MGVVDGRCIFTPYYRISHSQCKVWNRWDFMDERTQAHSHTASKWLSWNSTQGCLSLKGPYTDCLLPRMFSSRASCRECSVALFLHKSTGLSQGGETGGMLAPSRMACPFRIGTVDGCLPPAYVVGWRVNLGEHKIRVSSTSFADTDLISCWDFWCCVKL